MLYQKYQIAALLTRCKIYQQFFRQINQLCVPQLVFSSTISTIEMNPSFLLSLKSLFGRIFSKAKFILPLTYQQYTHVNYNIETKTLKKLFSIFSICALRERNNMTSNMIFMKKNRQLGVLFYYITFNAKKTYCKILYLNSQVYIKFPT